MQWIPTVNKNVMRGNMRMEGKELEKEGLQLGHELQEAFFWFHRHPELSYEEYQTTEKIREFLTEHGIGIMDSELETGLIAVIHGEREGAVRALRCDIDALPILEESGVPYASETKGKMHACGHDFHITAGLGCAALLQQNRKALAGTVKIIFQPAEESAKGAEKITETDLIDDVELIWGFHADPTNPVGTIGIREGYVAAAADRFLIKITGKGCHGAHPDTGIDPIPAAAAMVQAFQTVVTRNSDAFHPTLISVTRIEAGNTWNVVPETAELEGTVRTMNREDRVLFERRLREITEMTAKAYGASAEFQWYPGSPAVVNDPAMAGAAEETAKKQSLLTVPEESSMGGDDFSFYEEKRPGCYIKIGTGVGAAIHQPGFKVDPEILLPAAEYLMALFMENE